MSEKEIKNKIKMIHGQIGTLGANHMAWSEEEIEDIEFSNLIKSFLQTTTNHLNCLEKLLEI